MPKPLVSVVVPVYNAEQFIVTCVESLLDQSFQNLEILVVDDGSTDRGIEYLGSLADEERLRIYSQANSGGPARPRNVGISKAEGEYVFFFDADDIAEKTKVEKTVHAFDSAGAEFGMAATDFRLVDESGKELDPSYLRRFDRVSELMRAAGTDQLVQLASDEAYDLLLRGNFVGTSSVAVRKSALAACGGFDEALSNGDDYDLWLRLVQRFGLLLYGKPMHSYRKVGQSISQRPATRLAPSRITVLERQLECELTPGQKDVVRRKISSNYSDMAWEAKRSGQFGGSASYYLSAMRYELSFHALTRLAWSLLLAVAHKLRLTGR